MKTRVNYGNGTVGPTYASVREAKTEIARASEHRDNFASFYFVEKYVVGDAECPGEWVKVRS